MTAPQSPVLEFPAMLHGHLGAIRRDVRVQGQEWNREYLETGGFTQPRRMIQVQSGEVLLMHSAAEFDITPRPRWRIYLFPSVFRNLDEGVPPTESQRARETFESFCLNTPWGALAHAVSPPSPRSAERIARRLAALLHSWDMLQGPRYEYRGTNAHHTLAELMEYIYGMTMEAWCPREPASVRERLTRMVERMARATREECMEAVLRVLPILVQANTDLQHREVLSDPGFLRERLAALPPERWEGVSSADRSALNGPLYEWDRELEQQ